MARDIHDDGSHASIRRRLGYQDRRGEEPTPTEHRAAPGGLAPSSRTMHVHPRGGLAPTSRHPERKPGPIYSNEPAGPVFADHPTVSHPIGPGSTDRPIKDGPAWKSAERILDANRKLHNPTGKIERGNLNRLPVITK